MTNTDSILKSRDITLPTKVHLVNGMVFPAVMYGCESWALKKAELPRTAAFKLWCWTGLLRVPWTASRSGQSALREISREYCLQGLMLELRPSCWAHLMRRADSRQRPWSRDRPKTRRRGWPRVRWPTACPPRWAWVWANSRRQWTTEEPDALQSLGSQARAKLVTEQQWQWRALNP